MKKRETIKLFVEKLIALGAGGGYKYVADSGKASDIFEFLFFIFGEREGKCYAYSKCCSSRTRGFPQLAGFRVPMLGTALDIAH